MWSNNKKVDALVNILIFLVAINFFHYGQFILPVICLILFIDKKFKFKVNNIKVFVLLCLFGVSFCIFSRNSGFFRVMGFCVPMAYYIGSNMENTDVNSVKKLVYIIALGMASHVLLNMTYSFFLSGLSLFSKQGFYDIWLGTKVADTATAVNYIFIIGIVYYVWFYDNSKKTKILMSAIFMLLMLYDMLLGRRTPILMFYLVFLVSFIVDSLFINKSKRNIKVLMIIVGVILLIVVILLFIYEFCLTNPQREIVNYFTLFSKFRREGLSSGRLEVLLDTLKHAPYHLWGGQEISTIMEISPHDLLFDVYDHGGIITFLLLLVYLIYSIVVCAEHLKNIDSRYKLLVLPLFLTIGLQLCLEPIMTGSSNFLMIVIIFISVIEKATLNERNN